MNLAIQAGGRFKARHAVAFRETPPFNPEGAAGAAATGPLRKIESVIPSQVRIVIRHVVEGAG